MRLQGRQTEFFPTKYDKFEMGRQHLVNMRGQDGASFTQEDIDSNIEYLFPLIISYLHSLNQPQADSLTTRYRPQADFLNQPQADSLNQPQAVSPTAPKRLDKSVADDKMRIFLV